MGDIDPVGLVLFLALAALVGTVPVSLAVLWAYRKAVRRAMKRTAHTDLRPPPLDPPAALRPAAQIERVRGAPEGPLPPSYPRAVSQPRRIAVAYAVAGLAHATVATALVFGVNGLAVLPQRLAVVWAVLAWPVALTVMTVAVPGRRWKGLAVAVYAAVLAAVAGASAVEAAALLWFYVGVPTIALALMANPWLRTAGPFVAVVLVGAALGAVAAPSVMLGALSAGVVGTAAAVSAVGWGVGLLGFGLGALGLWRIARAYARGRWSDQMLHVSAWWLLYTVWQTLSLMSEAGWVGLVGLVPFVVFLVVLRYGLGRLPRGEPVRLLVLRVFGARGRSERLFRDLALSWRTLGGIGLINAPDLASETMEPDELLTFLSGRLRTLFVRTRADLDRQAAALEAGPDPDGRYRVTALMCHDDTWRASVVHLIRSADAVLVDLRGFALRNRGIRYELRLLLSTVPLARLVFVTDATADAAALEAALGEAWATMSDDAPNRAAEPTLTLVDLGTQGRRDVRGLLARLCAAAQTPRPEAARQSV